MIIETQYDVGHVFWVPRCYKRYEKEMIVWDGEEWHRDVPHYEAIAKQKEIVAIHINAGEDGACIQYGCVDFGADHQMSGWYVEKQITNYTEEQALEIAKQYAEKNEVYYGN